MARLKRMTHREITELLTTYPRKAVFRNGDTKRALHAQIPFLDSAGLYRCVHLVSLNPVKVSKPLTDRTYANRETCMHTCKISNKNAEYRIEETYCIADYVDHPNDYSVF